MRRVILGILVIFMAVSFCACGSGGKDRDGAVTVRIQNKVPDQITVMSASWSIDGKVIGTTGVEIAGDDGCLGDAFVSAFLYADDIESEKDLQKLDLIISVTEKDGGTFDAATLSLPSEYGDQYDLDLRYEDGSYVVWQLFDNGVEARLVN